jgi:hypothetical protein
MSPRGLERAEALAAGGGNARLEASILEFKAVLEINREAFAAAIAPLTQARETFAANGYRRGVALQEYMLGRALTGMGDHARALAHLRGAEALVDRDADPVTHGRCCAG